MFCSNCGKELPEGAKFCPECGKAVASESSSAVQQDTTTAVVVADNVSPKSRICALLLGVFVGTLGVHNFYLGKIGKGITQLFIFLVGIVSYSMVYGMIIEDLDIEYASIYCIAVFVIAVLTVKIWSMVDWIIIAAGSAKDRQGRAVTRW